MRNATEQEIQKTIIDYLRLKHYVVFKHHSTGSTIRDSKPVFFKYGDRGIADIIACSTKGTFVAVEVKKKGGKPSPEQLDFLERVNRAGGLGILAYDLETVVTKVEELARRDV